MNKIERDAVLYAWNAATRETMEFPPSDDPGEFESLFMETFRLCVMDYEPHDGAGYLDTDFIMQEPALFYGHI